MHGSWPDIGRFDYILLPESISSIGPYEERILKHDGRYLWPDRLVKLYQTLLDHLNPDGQARICGWVAQWEKLQENALHHLHEKHPTVRIYGRANLTVVRENYADPIPSDYEEWNPIQHKFPEWDQ